MGDCGDRTDTYLAKNPVGESGFKASKRPILFEQCSEKKNDEFHG
jgi:hypothetical protein